MNPLLTRNSDQSTEVLAVHGWGFDRRCWQFWQEQFEQRGYSFQAFDRGYFNHPSEPIFTENASKKIILVHSFGLHLCPIDLLQQADLLIAFNSFLSFHPETKAAKRRSQLVLQQMIRQFEQAPEIVLENFYVQAGYAQLQNDVQAIDYPLLRQDLQQLGESRLDPVYLKSIAKILVFQSSNDRIVAASQTQEFLTEFPQSCELMSFLNTEHALPFTHAAECWSRIQSVLYLPVTS